ncbi:MAG TPA: hypothetical protein VGP09_01250 [Caballeronia sp.]|nr:hypothetical protein [Caballeronia sp.]
MLDYRASHRPVGDPAKAAQAILGIAELDEPPLRLLLGSDVVHIAEQVHEARGAMDVKWRHVSLSTDAGDAAEWRGLIDKLGTVKQPARD